MANIPGWPHLPSYSWIKYPVRKIDSGYYTKGYSNFEFKGTPREIAKQIIIQLTTNPETGPRKNFVGPFALDFKPELRCFFVMETDPDPPDLDCNALAEEITKELRSLEKLIPFS